MKGRRGSSLVQDGTGAHRELKEFSTNLQKNALIPPTDAVQGMTGRSKSATATRPSGVNRDTPSVQAASF